MNSRIEETAVTNEQNNAGGGGALPHKRVVKKQNNRMHTSRKNKQLMQSYNVNIVRQVEEKPIMTTACPPI